MPNDINNKSWTVCNPTEGAGSYLWFLSCGSSGLCDSLDYASDKHEMKENARKMMRMTIEINKTNFYFDTTQRPEYLKVVHCKTCHRGEPYPVD
jgi:hypothetical protein